MLRRFGFDAVDRACHARTASVRAPSRADSRERQRFFHLTEPAITRKRDIEGMAIKSKADLRVVSVEPLGGAKRLYDITTGTGDFIANGVVSHNCFARPTHKYLDFNAGRDFEKEIVVKVNVPEVLRVELRRPSWKGEHVAMGTNTDPYQWVESRYRLMPGIWEALRDHANPCSVLTKSPLRPARPAAAEGDRRAHDRLGEPLDPDAGTRRRGGRPSRTRPIRARGWRPWRS